MDFRNPIGRVITETHRGSPNPLLHKSHNRTRGRSLHSISRVQSPSSGSLRDRGEIRELRFLTHLRRGLNSPPGLGTVDLAGQENRLSLGLRMPSFRHRVLSLHVEPWGISRGIVLRVRWQGINRWPHQSLQLEIWAGPIESS